MSDPMRFQPGGLRGAGDGVPADEAHILRALTEHVERMTRMLDDLYNHQQRKRLTLHTEYAYVAAGNRAEIGPQTQDQFRVTYIWAYCFTAATLYLKGSISSTSLAIPLAANTPLNVVLGDEFTGGILLEEHDNRYITTTNAGDSSQIVAFLCGEVMKDSHLS